MSNEKAKKIRKATRAAIAQRDAYVNETTADIASMYRKAADGSSRWNCTPCCFLCRRS
mgnify:CR=1 FL=1